METNSTVKACKLPDIKRGLVVFEKESCCVKTLMSKLVKVYAFQLLNDKSTLKGGEEFIGAALVFLSAVESRRLKHFLDSWGQHVV